MVVTTTEKSIPVRQKESEQKIFFKKKPPFPGCHRALSPWRFHFLLPRANRRQTIFQKTHISYDKGPRLIWSSSPCSSPHSSTPLCLETLSGAWAIRIPLLTCRIYTGGRLVEVARVCVWQRGGGGHGEPPAPHSRVWILKNNNFHPYHCWKFLECKI